MKAISSIEWNDKKRKLGLNNFTQKEKDFLDSYFVNIERSPNAAHIKCLDKSTVNITKLNDDWFLMAFHSQGKDTYSGLYIIDQFDEFVKFIKTNQIC